MHHSEETKSNRSLWWNKDYWHDILRHDILSVKTPTPRKRLLFLGYENKNMSFRFCEMKLCFCQLSFSCVKRGNKEETKQSVKRDKRKCEHGVKTESANALTRKILWTRDIISPDEQCTELLHFMLPVRKSKNYCCSYELRQIICPLNKHSQNKHNFGKIFEIQAFEVDINNNNISCNCYVKIKNKFHEIMGNGSFRVQYVSTDTWHSAVNQSNRTVTLKLFKYADWKQSKLCDYLAYELGKTFLFKETPFIFTL